MSESEDRGLVEFVELLRQELKTIQGEPFVTCLPVDTEIRRIEVLCEIGLELAAEEHPMGARLIKAAKELWEERSIAD